MKGTMVFFIALLTLAGCKHELPEIIDGISYFGEKISDEGALPLSDALVQLDREDELEAVKVKGTVTSVCQKKGCWMTLADDGHSEDESLFVRFKDYGFFMPKDISGQKVVIEGKLFKEVTPVDELRHYAEDGGASPEKIAEIQDPKVELKFMASGVILYP